MDGLEKGGGFIKKKRQEAALRARNKLSVRAAAEAAMAKPSFREGAVWRMTHILHFFNHAPIFNPCIGCSIFDCEILGI